VIGVGLTGTHSWRPDMSSRVLVALSLPRGGARRDPGHGGNRFLSGGTARAGDDFARSRPFHSSAGKPMLSRLSRVSTYQRKRLKVGSWQNERYVRPMVGLMCRRRRRSVRFGWAHVYPRRSRVTQHRVGSRSSSRPVERPFQHRPVGQRSDGVLESSRPDRSAPGSQRRCAWSCPRGLPRRPPP